MQRTRLVIDGHVHYYNCYDFENFFTMAINNIDKMSSSLYQDDSNYNYKKVLLLTEGKDNDYFSQFKKKATFSKESKYKFENTLEDYSIILTKGSEYLCYVLAGRQIVTRENLEVLSIASVQRIEDGLPINDVVNILIDNEQIAVLAWGVGKWSLKRGKIIKDIIKKYHSPYLFIGDNSSRPSFWPKPRLYLLAEKHNIQILGGSDPLPFSEEINRVGTFGFYVEGDFQNDKPGESFRNILISNKENINNLGYQDNFLSFIKRRAKTYCYKHFKSHVK